MGRLGNSAILTFGVNREPMDGFFSGVGAVVAEVAGTDIVDFPLTSFPLAFVSEDNTGNNMCFVSSVIKLLDTGGSSCGGGGGGGGGGMMMAVSGMSHCCLLSYHRVRIKI